MVKAIIHNCNQGGNSYAIKVKKLRVTYTIHLLSTSQNLMSVGKASVYNAGDLGSIPGSGRSPGEGNGNPLQYYCLENPMDRGDW